MDVAARGASVPTKASSQAHHLSVAERAANGTQVRVTVPREIHGEGSPAPDRPDPLGMLEEQDRSRVPELVLIRRERLAASPFSFYRPPGARRRQPGRQGRRPIARTSLRGARRSTPPAADCPARSSRTPLDVPPGVGRHRSVIRNRVRSCLSSWGLCRQSTPWRSQPAWVRLLRGLRPRAAHPLRCALRRARCRGR
jgi:hypothetical protein